MEELWMSFIEACKKAFPAVKIYPHSVHTVGNLTVCMADFGEKDMLMCSHGGEFEGGKYPIPGFPSAVMAPLNHANAGALKKVFPFTAPSPVLGKDFTVGVGDRLGIATPGHIRVFEHCDAYPVFAQQSIRELNFTHRTYDEVLDSAVFAVFRENFTKGYGADGDHLKTRDEIKYALSCGYTMITLDCSEHIHGCDAEGSVSPDLKERYLGKTYSLPDGLSVFFDGETLSRAVKIYGEAIEFAAAIYIEFFKGNDSVDFELSIDETATPTDPAHHFFIASELSLRGVKMKTMAPRFVGEFQKGVDYIGNIARFEREFAVHAAIARHFGYKISVHSGSDKFSVFPIIGKLTGCRVHLKTAGTNWLEAMRVVAEHDPALYREVHEFALNAFAEANKFYHVTTNLASIPPLSSLSDDELPSLFTQNDARQLIHITYGLILTAKTPDGSLLFRDRLYKLWRERSDEYASKLEAHIGKHISKLYGR